MKTIKSILLALVLLISAMSGASAFDFADVDFWVGSGANQAMLVIDWNDGKSPVSLAWGFRWDGTAYGIDMLHAIAAADSRLFVYESGSSSYGIVLQGIGYDVDNDGFATTPAVNFVNGVGTGNLNESRTATDTADHYKEGFASAGYWTYYLKSASSASWGYSGTGMSGRKLANGCWDGWSWAPGFSSTKPDTPVAAAVPVPEPSSIIALATGGIGLVGFRIRRRK